MWKSRTKQDLMIEVWEALDCESIGENEIIEIEKVLNETFGAGAVDFPMRIARVLADEGAELRHAEILNLDFQRRSNDPYDAYFRNIFKFSTFEEALRSLRNLENLRQAFNKKDDPIGLRRLRDAVTEERDGLNYIASDKRLGDAERAKAKEIAEWISLWIKTPAIFESWIDLRRNSPEFASRFGKEK